MASMKINIINRSGNKLPEYSTPMSAGMDIRAMLDAELIIKPMKSALIPTGLYIELPEGYEAQIRPRSGLAFNMNVGMLNSPGTIDADYRGEIKVSLINLSDREVVIRNGDRICQMVVSKFETVEWNESDSLDLSERGSGGFGHTGLQ